MTDNEIGHITTYSKSMFNISITAQRANEILSSLETIGKLMNRQRFSLQVHDTPHGYVSTLYQYTRPEL